MACAVTVLSRVRPKPMITRARKPTPRKLQMHKIGNRAGRKRAKILGRGCNTAVTQYECIAVHQRALVATYTCVTRTAQVLTAARALGQHTRPKPATA